MRIYLSAIVLIMANSTFSYIYLDRWLSDSTIGMLMLLSMIGIVDAIYFALKSLPNIDDGDMPDEYLESKPYIIARMDTSQRDSMKPTDGMLILNDTIGKVQKFENDKWVDAL